MSPPIAFIFGLMRRIRIINGFLVLFLIPFIELLIILFIVTTHKAIKGTTLFVIEKTGHEISYFLPSLLAAEKAYIMLVSRNATNTSSISQRFSHTCYSLSNIKKCILNNPNNWTIPEIANQVRYISKKYSVTNIITYDREDYSFSDREIISRACITLTGKVNTENIFNDNIENTLSVNGSFHDIIPKNPKIYLDKKVDKKSFKKFFDVYKDMLVGKVIFLNPFKNIDPKITKGLSYPLANILMRERAKNKFNYPSFVILH